MSGWGSPTAAADVNIGGRSPRAVDGREKDRASRRLGLTHSLTSPRTPEPAAKQDLPRCVQLCNKREGHRAHKHHVCLVYHARYACVHAHLMCCTLASNEVRPTRPLCDTIQEEWVQSSLTIQVHK